MKSSLFQTLFLVMGSSAASLLDAHHVDNDNAMGKLGCGTVNFLMTAFLPTAHTTAFCSAYLQVAEQTSTRTATMAESTRTITETRSIVLPTTTRSLSTAHTMTVDLWSGKPACTAVPKFEWVREWRSQQSQRSSDLVKAACSCLEIPEATTTALAIANITPTVTVSEGITGLAEVTSVETQVVVPIHTKFTFLSQEIKRDLVNRTVVLEDKSLILPRIERVGAHQSNRSRRAGPGAVMAGVVQHVGSWKHVVS